MAYDTTIVSPSGPGLMTPALLAQHNNMLSPFVPLTIPSTITIAVGTKVVAGFLADRPMTVSGFSFSAPSITGTTLSASLYLAVNGSAVGGTTLPLTVSSNAGSIAAASPVMATKGNLVQLMLNVTAAVGVSPGDIYSNSQVTYT